MDHEPQGLCWVQTLAMLDLLRDNLIVHRPKILIIRLRVANLLHYHVCIDPTYCLPGTRDPDLIWSWWSVKARLEKALADIFGNAVVDARYVHSLSQPRK